MSDDEFPILPSTKVAALLDHYPQLEDVLIDFAPPFKKLRNPLLRRSVAKVASLRQASAAARVPVDELVNHLRAAVGQARIETPGGAETESYFGAKPDWVEQLRVAASIDERDGDKADDATQMPVVAVLNAALELGEAEMVELITDFVPAPGIDLMRTKGYRVWSMQDSSGVVRSYFSKPPADP